MQERQPGLEHRGGERNHDQQDHDDHDAEIFLVYQRLHEGRQDDDHHYL